MTNTFEAIDKGYFITRFKFIVEGAMLTTRAYEYTRKRNERYEITVNMAETTAVRVIAMHPDFGRHFEDGVLRAFKENGFPLGFATPSLRGFQNKHYIK
ncbi:MAG: hypothetical protein PHX74_12435 [Candidatus Sumerlaeales bacterium]|nr:hypothetical protein [Candidatus Sumerlaeales bacterium]